MHNKKAIFSSLIVLVSLMLSLVFPTSVLADDNTPPATETVEVVTPPEEVPNEETVDTIASESPATAEPVLTEETMTTDEIVSDVPTDVATPEASADTASTANDGGLLSQLPEGTDVVVQDENGDVVPLVSQEAVEIVQITDPMWCPQGIAPGGIGCTTNFSNSQALINNMDSSDPATAIPPTTYEQNGIIYFTVNPGSGSFTLVPGGGNALETADYNILKGYNLILQGGWNGTPGATTFTQTSFGNNPFTIGTFGNPWVGSITLNDFAFSGVSSANAVTIYTTGGNITLDNVDVLDQTSSGLLPRNTALLSSTSGNITVNDSTFDGDNDGWFDRNLGFSATTTSGSISISDTTFQQANGLLVNYNGATLSAPNITLVDVISQSNDGNGILVNGTASTIVNVIGGSLINNGGYGLRLNGNGTLYVGPQSTSCTENGSGCYNVSPVMIVLGCTDPTAFNYNSSANRDDGSCEAVVLGCTDETAFNYNSSANTDDGSCEAVVLGCTDETAFNYNPEANTDDGSCEAVVLGCTDESASNYSSSANTDDGTCVPVGSGIPSSSTGTASFIIPVTGDQAAAISCTKPSTTLTMADFEVTFTNYLCGYSAVLTEAPEDSLFGALPYGSKFVGGIGIVLLQEGNVVSPFPADTTTTLSFEIPSGMTGETLVILHWDPTADSGSGAWVEKSVTVADGKVTLTIDMPGTYVLVVK